MEVGGFSACTDPTAPAAKSERLTFVFSGQLLRRNNVGLVCDCLIKLWREMPHGFRFILAASGPEETTFWKTVRAEPGLSSAIELDREYSSWEERLRTAQKRARSSLSCLPFGLGPCDSGVDGVRLCTNYNKPG